MAEILVSAVSEALIGKLVSIASDEISLVWGVRGEMLKLQNTLRSIQAVLTDAERQQVEKETVKLWLENLKDAVYEAEDILDEFDYDAHKRKIEVRKREKVKIFFSNSNHVGFSRKMAHKIRDLNRTLHQISEDKERFSFNVSESTKYKGSSRNRETHSHEDISMFVGREKEKLEIIDLLLDRFSHRQIYRVILIVAMGGLGKSSLARVIYRDDGVIQHFEKRIWICVSDNSNKFQVFSQLVESIKGEKKEYSSLEAMVNIVKQNLQQKRYLIVLDDMWKEDHDEWDNMLDDLLLLGAQGSKVIITSRSKEVASPSSLYRCHLEGLSEGDCWTMLEKIAFGPGGVGKTIELIEIGKNIARKCGGVPLTTTVLGSLMSSKKVEHHWRLIENSEIWNLPAGEKKIMSVLKLSYDHLEPHLKQCFRYCSLYPKDWIIERKKLIWMWMAEGFLGRSRPSIEMETLGNDYFNSLLSNSFLQEEIKDGFGIIESCKMHDLVHDLAQSVSKGESSIIKVNEIIEEDISGLRRVSLVFENDEFSPLPTTLAKAKKLRALISTGSPSIGNSYDVGINSYALMMILNNFDYVRVLDLSNSSFSELPPSIAKLKHLRYLDLTDCSELTVLPSSFTTLYNLQTLILKRCYKLRYFPEEMRKLTKLSHLEMREGYPMVLLKEARFLTSLISLPVYAVGEEEGCGIEELRDLNLLSGDLSIYNLERIRSGKDAQKGSGLKEKQHILGLELYWFHPESREENTCQDFEVLEGLQPHRNLERLEIHDYAGSNFPTWTSLLPNLVHVVLYYCARCEFLPGLGLLPSLKCLEICFLTALKSIGNEFYGGGGGGGGGNSANVSSFPSLEYLAIMGMSSLVEWSDQVTSSSSFSSFPRLQTLRVKDCPELRVMPYRFPSLKSLDFRRSYGRAIASLVETNQSSLTSIEIFGCKELVSLPVGLVRGNNILSRLEIKFCSGFQGFTSPSIDVEDAQVLPSNSVEELWLRDCGLLYARVDLRGFNSLTWLSIGFGDSPKCISAMESIIKKKSGIEYLPNLTDLRIGSCFEEVDSFPFPDVNSEEEEGTVTGNYFPSLRILLLAGWSRLQCLPNQIQYITSLETLEIREFESLVALPEWLGKLNSLQILVIEDCENLKYLPSQEQMLHLTSLRKLIIKNSPVLGDRCKGGGEEAYKISHKDTKFLTQDWI